MSINVIEHIESFNTYAHLLTLIIGVPMLIVAIIQSRIQKSNLKIILFDKRFKVYIDSQKLYQEYTHGCISDDTFSNFICSFHASEMLFPKCSGVYEFLNEIHKSAVSFNDTNTQMKKIDEPTTLETIYKYNREACSNLNGFLEQLNKLMKPFIKID